jgi:hypothetical protein
VDKWRLFVVGWNNDERVVIVMVAVCCFGFGGGEGERPADIQESLSSGLKKGESLLRW